MAADELDGESTEQWHTVRFGKQRPPAQAAPQPDSSAQSGSRSGHAGMVSTSWADDVVHVDPADKPETVGSASSDDGSNGTDSCAFQPQHDRQPKPPLTARERHIRGNCEPCYYYFMRHERGTKCAKGSECSHCHDGSHGHEPDRLRVMVQRFEERHSLPRGGRPSSGPGPNAVRTVPPPPQPLGGSTSSSRTSLASLATAANLLASDDWPAIGHKATGNAGGADAAAGAWAQRARGQPAPSTDAGATTTAPSTPSTPATVAEPAPATIASPPPTTLEISGSIPPEAAIAPKGDDGRAATPKPTSTLAVAASSAATVGSVRPRLSTPLTVEALAPASSSSSAVNLVTPAAAHALVSASAATMTLANVPGINMGDDELPETPQSSGTSTAASDAGTDSNYGPPPLPAPAPGAAVGVRPRPPPSQSIPNGGYSPVAAVRPPRRRPNNTNSIGGPGAPGRFLAGPPVSPMAVPMVPMMHSESPGVGAQTMFPPPMVAMMPPPGPVPEFLSTCQQCGHARAAVLVSYCGHRLCEQCFAQTNFRACAKSGCQNMKLLQGSWVKMRVYF